MKNELSYLLCIDPKGRLVLNYGDLQLSFVSVVTGLWDETLFSTVELTKQ